MGSKCHKAESDLDENLRPDRVGAQTGILPRLIQQEIKPMRGRNNKNNGPHTGNSSPASSSVINVIFNRGSGTEVLLRMFFFHGP
jgi:hypothetical protein